MDLQVSFMSHIQKKKGTQAHAYLLFEHCVILLQDFGRPQVIGETMVSDHTDVSGNGRTLPASHLLR